MASIQSIASNISSSTTAKVFSQKASGFVANLGSNISKGLDEGGSKLVKFIAKNEPTNHDNSFIPMATLMVGTVIVPRVFTAAKRNPNDKQATEDEIKEILFRDVQTVVIVLFLLKAVTALVSSIASKAKGLPMTTAPYEKMFNDVDGSLFKKLGAHAKEFVGAPLQKLKILGKNILSTIQPVGGVAAKTNAQFKSQYSGFKNLSQISSMLNGIEKEHGNKEKVFKTAMDAIIAEQEKFVKGIANTPESQKAFDILKKISSEGATSETFATLAKGENLSSAQEKAKNVIVDFFKNPDNAVVRSATNLNAYLNGASLAFESAYLGFGLPALNQKRLEKKYLNKNPQQVDEFVSHNNVSTLKLKEQEVKLFHNFIAK